METIHYQLKSNPEITVEVPAEYAATAQYLVDLAVNSPFSLTGLRIDEHPYLGNRGIFYRTIELTEKDSGTPESLQLQDIVYLRVCTK